MKNITFLGYPLGRTLLSSFLKNERMDAMSSFRCWRCRSMSSSVVEVPEFGVDDPHDDTKVMEKDNALRMALTQLAGDFCNESMLSLRRFFLTRRAPVISTGSLRLDLALGIGGLPKGRIVEIYGQEASGKTTLALHIIKEAQKLGGYCAYLDVENALDPMLAESMGVNTEELLISRPDSAENMLSVVNTLAKSGSMDVVVVDSVAALVPQYELDVHIGSTVRDLQPLIMNQGLRKIHASLGRSETLVIFVNQTRSNAKSGQGIGHAEEVTCGGNSLRFYAAVRMKTTRKRLFKTNDQFDSLGICVQVMKNKLAPAMRKTELKIEFGRGICFEFDDFLELACEKGIILMEGGSYFIEGEVLDNKEDAILHLAENEEILHTMITTLRKQLFRI